MGLFEGSPIIYKGLIQPKVQFYGTNEEQHGGVSVDRTFPVSFKLSIE